MSQGLAVEAEPARALAPATGRRSGVGIAVALAAAALLFGGRALVAEPMRIASESMAPTLRSGDHVLVDKLHPRGTDDVMRGDLVAFERARSGEVLLKRVVAVGGDTVAIEDGRLAVNGRPRVEPYADQRAIDSVYFGPVKVQPGTVFVLGDDRANSIDSRSFGGVPTRDVVGRVVARVWPPQRWGTPG